MGFLKIFSGKGRGSGDAVPLVADERFLETILFAEERELKPLLNDVAGKGVLEISPRLKSLSGILREKGAAFTARLGDPGEKGVSVVSRWETLPFLDRSWDFILVRSAFFKGRLTSLIREAARTLKPAGGLLLSDFHPFSDRIQKEHLKNPVGEEGMGPGFERYFRIFREEGLKIEGVKELFFEGSLRRFFVSPAEKKMFEVLRRTPFIIFFLLRKT